MLAGEGAIGAACLALAAYEPFLLYDLAPLLGTGGCPLLAERGWRAVEDIAILTHGDPLPRRLTLLADQALGALRAPLDVTRATVDHRGLTALSASLVTLRCRDSALGADLVTLGAGLMALDASGVTLHARRLAVLALRPHRLPLGARDVTLRANLVALCADLVSLGPDLMTLSAGLVSLSANLMTF